MADIPSRLLPHTVSVESFVGTGAYGDTYAAAVPVRAMVDEARRVVVAADGVEVTSEARLATKLADADTLLPQSLVTIPWDGRKRKIISVHRGDDAGMGAWQHLEVDIT